MSNVTPGGDPPKTGSCYCGCRKSTGNWWAPGHDNRIDRVLRKELGLNRAGFFLEHGYGPSASDKRACDLPE